MNALPWLVSSLIAFEIHLVDAHEDPLGDIYPRVVTSSGRFEVYCNNNRHLAGVADADLNKPLPVFRTTFSPKGVRIAERESFTDTEPKTRATLEEEQYGSTAAAEPKLPPISKRVDDRFRLGWWEESKYILSSSPARSETRGVPFLLNLVDASSGNVLKSAEIGAPARIYVFACVSEAIRVGSEIVVAWMEEKSLPDEKFTLADGTSGFSKASLYRMVLTRWNPESGRVVHASVAEAIDGNISVSVGNIGNTVLVAWHELGKIRARAVDLETALFTPGLSDLQVNPQREEAVSKEIEDLPPAIK